MSKSMKNAGLLGCFAVGAIMVAATAAVRSENGTCSGCPSQYIKAFFFGEGDGCGSTKAKTAEGGGGCCSKKASATLAKAEDTPKAGCSATCNKTMSDVAQLTYRVGDLDTPCIKTADATSREKNLPVKFVVAGDVFDECGLAAAKLASLLETQIPNMGEIVVVNESAPSPSGCPFSGKTTTTGDAKTSYKVAGISFASMKDAEAAQANVRAALAKYTTPSDAPAAAGCPHAAEMAAKAGAASAPSGCCMKKGQVATASEKSEPMGCCASLKSAQAAEGQVASAVKLGVCCDLNTISEGGCCPPVQNLVSVRAKIRSLVEAALSAQPKTEQTASL